MNNGSMAERFLSPNIRHNVCSIIKNTEARENFSILLRDVNIILTVTQDMRDNVDTQKLKQLGIDIMSHLKSSFLTTRNKPWIAIMDGYPCTVCVLIAGSWLPYALMDLSHSTLNRPKNTGTSMSVALRVAQVPVPVNTMFLSTFQIFSVECCVCHILLWPQSAG